MINYTKGHNVHPQQHYRRRFLIVLGLAMMLSVGGWALGVPAQAQGGDHLVYLPLVVRQGSSAPPTPIPSPVPSPSPTVPPTPVPPTNSGGLFLARDIKTASAGVAVDAQGGMHMVYTAYVGYGSLSPAYYAYWMVVRRARTRRTGAPPTLPTCSAMSI